MIFNRITFHFHASGNQLVALKNRRHLIENVIVGPVYVFRHHIFEREHTVHIHITRTGNKILLVGVFSGKLETDQMTSVIETLAVHKVIL